MLQSLVNKNLWSFLERWSAADCAKVCQKAVCWRTEQNKTLCDKWRDNVYKCWQVLTALRLLRLTSISCGCWWSRFTDRQSRLCSLHTSQHDSQTPPSLGLPTYSGSQCSHWAPWTHRQTSQHCKDALLIYCELDEKDELWRTVTWWNVIG